MSPPDWDLECGDAFAWLSRLPSESVDLSITDPPYESLEKHRAKGTTTRLKVSSSSSNPWFGIIPNARFPDLMAEVYRVLQRNSHAYMFCDMETAYALKPAAESVGFKYWNTLIWDKRTIGMGYHYRSRYEMILFFEKGKRRLNDLGMPDVLECPRVLNGWPTEKPVELLSKLIAQSTEPDELVLDGFMGSGATGEAALRLNRRFSGNDLSPKSIELASERLAPLGRRWA